MGLLTKHPLKAFRDAHDHMSQEQAAQLVGITQAMWSHLESGGFASPRVAKRISDLTGVALESLLNFGEKDSGDAAEPAIPPATGNPKDLP